MTHAPLSDWDGEEELEPRRVWTPADRWRLVTWVLIFANVLGLLLLAPVGDGTLQRTADASGSDPEQARLVFWVTVVAATLVSGGLGAAAAATKQRWAIVMPLLGTAASWVGFAIATSMV
ncbi:hypothetical protein [Agrococcus beijingensis]|uniref:hypothetical protein n=1 Tax=Agrococcus beijingensis TaxID=3068634 RepID=UPI002741436B|nr:hypothetical protein [Agrococcus sp. REN33]